MSLATFHERVTTDALLPAGIRGELGLASATAVYVGTFPRRVRERTEVQIEPAAPMPRDEDGAGELTEHRYLLRVYHRDPGDGSQTRASIFGVVDDYARQLVRYLDGTRPFVADLPDLIAVGAQVEDSTPFEETDRAERVVAVSFLVRGTGDVDQGAGAVGAGALGAGA
jgi:hypothetical protein